MIGWRNIVLGFRGVMERRCREFGRSELMRYEGGRMEFGVVLRFQTWLTEGSEGAPSLGRSLTRAWKELRFGLF